MTKKIRSIHRELASKVEPLTDDEIDVVGGAGTSRKTKGTTYTTDGGFGGGLSSTTDMFGSLSGQTDKDAGADYVRDF